MKTIDQPTPTSSPKITATRSGSFRIVGYVTSWSEYRPLPYDKLTHINYAFVIPNSDGTLQEIRNPRKLERIVSNAHENGVQVLLSVGGWGPDAEFESLAGNPAYRSTFIHALIQLASQHNLDGIDIDWEYPDKASRLNYLALIQELRAALPENKLLTTAVVALGENGEGIPAKSFEFLDFVNLMVYDGFEHASINYAQNSLDYWYDRGLPKSKTVLGVPFYSRPTAVPYKDLVSADPSAAFLDSFEYQGETVSYNGIPTMKLKAQIAMSRASGIMIWTLEYDTEAPDTSLLNTIYKEVHSE